MASSTTYELRLFSRYSNQTEGVSQSVRFTTNSPPSGGTFSVVPATGLEQTT